MKEKKETAGKTAKTAKTIDIATVYGLINPAKLTKMETSERFAVILATRQLKKVTTEYEDFLKDAREKLKPEGFDEIAVKLQKEERLTLEEAAAFNKYSKELNECVTPVANKEVELDFKPLSEDALGRFVESNDFSVSEIMLIGDVIG